MPNLYLLSVCIGFLLCSCTPTSQQEQAEPIPPTALDAAPAWAKEAIWYQIFVERFRNGDPSNDPRPQDMKGAFPDFLPDNWSVTPWGHDWYALEDWQKDLKVEGFYARIQARRFGGDLQGVMDQMDYIQSLGINAVYFNPLNDAPSLHKYDARNYHHIDRNFGPDPDRDAAIMAAENPGDPSTWQWTSADSLFLLIVDAFHERGIKVILDYSWNHTGTQFWALQDIAQKGQQSPYIGWFNILAFDNPDTPENEFDFEGWAGSKNLPVVKKDILPANDHEMPFEGNLSSSSFKEHVYDVSKRWLDPNQDGDPSDGIDGYRLDVAGEVPMGFWRDYRKKIRNINPEAYLVGEIWWQTWPDSLMDPRPFLQGDQFDAIMNYRWYRIARGFFAQASPKLKPSGFVAGINQINKDIDKGKVLAMMNMSASHDSPRLSTSLFNKNLYKYQAKPNDDPNYLIQKPTARTLTEQKMFLLHQFTFIGAPQIWNGDEIGMWGADDPDCRKPMVWDDLVYEDEKATYVEGQNRAVEEVKQDKALFSYYQQLIQMRKSHPVLSNGELEFILADDENMTLVYRRFDGEKEIIVAFNRSEETKTLEIPVTKEGVFSNLLDQAKNEWKTQNGTLLIPVDALSGTALIRK